MEIDKEKLNKVWSFHLREMAVEIMRLGLLVSKETDHSVQVEFHGFKSTALTVTIWQTKELSSKQLYTTGFAGVWLDAYDWFTEKIYEQIMAELRQAKSILIACLEGKYKIENKMPDAPDAA